VPLPIIGHFFMENEIKQLSSKIFHNVFLWASESVSKSFLVVTLIFVFGIPLIGFLQGLVRSFPYIAAVTDIINFLSSISMAEFLALLAFFLLVLWLIHISKELRKTYYIEDNFKLPDLNKWSIPLNAGWTIQKCEDASGYMLSVTNSEYPGTLKGAYGWYDYELNFLVKIESEVIESNQNFSVAVRSDNNLNGVMLQITRTHMKPHLLFNGTYIRDTENDIQLPTILKTNIWHKVRIRVVGGNIELIIDNYKVSYKIPTKVLNVENQKLSRTTTMRDVVESNRKIESLQKDLYELFDAAQKMPEGDEKKNAFGKIDESVNKMPAFAKVVLEYQKGSIGFRESGSEHAYFRKVMVKKLE
jgi:hypothetical protein